MIDVRRAAERFHTRLDWLDSWHSFSFGEHHDPANTGHGLLLVSNDDTVAPGGGFGTHGHRDMEIVTWVLSGALAHRDSSGGEGVIRPKMAQRMSAGRGVRHSEMNASATEPVHFLQMWVRPDGSGTGIAPSYEERDLSGAFAPGAGLVAVASGRDHSGAVHLHQRDAVLWVADLAAGEPVTLPPARHVHVFVATGAATLDAADLGAGDAARLTDAGPCELRATADGTEVVVWETA
jgi:redox-sensitive bicupin YhaK (pirin superfamily)